MGGNPVETKVDVPQAAAAALAEAAGTPAAVPTRSVFAALRKYRKLALILGGAGITAAGGGYGYKYFTANPGRANAQPEAPAVAAKPEAPPVIIKPDETKPPVLDETPLSLPPVIPVKNESPALPDVTPPPVKSPAAGLPDLKLPDLAPPPAPAAGKSDTEPLPVTLPPVPGGPPVPAPAPTLPEIKLPASDKVKPPVAAPDMFKAPEPPPIDPKKVDPTAAPAALPAGVTEKKVQPDTPPAPVIRVQGIDPPPVKVPGAPKTEVPAVPTIEVPPPAPAPAKVDTAPMIDVPPPPAPVKKDDPVVPPPAPAAKNDDVPVISPPMIGGPKKDDLPPPPLGPAPKKDDLIVPPPPPAGGASTDRPPAVKLPAVKVPDAPAVKIPDTGSPSVPPPINLDPPPPVGGSARPSATPPEKKKDNFDEDWHTWKPTDTMALISREYYKTADYARALEAYNKDHRKPGDIVRVPPPWVLEEKFPDLIGKADKAPDRSDRAAPPQARPDGADGLRFEPVAPRSADRGVPPPAVVTNRSKDEYRVTAEAGETIREVARNALGDANRWKQLYDLNPGIDPTVPIPVGTTLRLPR